jgi:hypothetical protein
MTNVTGLWEYNSEGITGTVAATCKMSAGPCLMSLFFCFPSSNGGFSLVCTSYKSLPL